MIEVYLGLGSNIGDRRRFLIDTATRLRKQLRGVSLSSIYQTKPWGDDDQPDYLNMCLKGRTSLKPDELLNFLNEVETAAGRTRRRKWGPREIDIDILFYGNKTIKRPGLEIPHRYLAERAFVLIPLAEIAPDFIHPAFQKTVSQFAEEIDSSEVSLYEKL